MLENSQITKCDGFCRNYCVLLKISKELSCKFFKVLGQVLSSNSYKIEFITSAISRKFDRIMQKRLKRRQTQQNALYESRFTIN
ncbi:hypothetical protein B0192_02140 [Leptospira interrogans serovar Australis]|nr:hypothetical protein B0192_02140 [Leptospira interrogans serovar Australis]